MSHVAYDLMLSDAMNDLQEQVKVEHVPAEKPEGGNGKPNIENWPNDEIFQHLACLYIKYIDIYRKLEQCYDQMVHPQKRMFIKKVLESTICRICEMKKDLCLFNPRPKSLYVHLDQLLFDLKYDPSIIEIPVPRYFQEDDRVKVELAFKEKVERDIKKKKKKKAAKKKKKKKAVEEEAPPEPRSMKEKEFLVNKVLLQVHQTTDAEIEIVHDPFSLDMEMVSAIRLIQKNERGRQGRLRYNVIIESVAKANDKKNARNDMKTGKATDMTAQEKEQFSAEFIQRRIRGILCRKDCEQKRQEEMIFLGMQRRQKTDEEIKHGPIQQAIDIAQQRKRQQEDNMITFDRAKQELEDEIDNLDGNDIQDQMLKERRDWIQEQKTLQAGKPPADITKFYERNNLEQPLTAEELAAKALEDEAASGKKGKKEAKKAEKKGKKGKGDGDDDGDGKAVAKIGPSEVVQKFDEFYLDFNTTWATRDETDNHDQDYDRGMARDSVEPIVRKKKEKYVDEMIKQELKNMMILAKMKIKKPKKPKKPKKKKAKKIKLPGAKLIAGRDEYDLLVELIQHNIVKKLPVTKLTDFIGEFNYIHSMLDDIKDTPYDPSMALIRQLVTEYIIFPLGSDLVRQRLPEHVRSFLFYGPQGTGKTQVVRAIASETKSVVFDMSPINLAGDPPKFPGKECEKLIAMVFVVAKEFAPSVVYIDEAEKVWPAKKKKKKGQKKKSKAEMLLDPSRMKKALAKWRTKWVTEETRITIIACTSEPQEGNKKDFRKFFDKAIYFPFPDYTTRRLMWKNFIVTRGGQLKIDFPLSTLAHISAGYSAGSIKKTVENVLTDFRKSKMEQRPLALSEFIGPLSLCANTMDDQYDDFKKFTDDITGDGKRRAEIEAALRGEDGGDDPKKGKKGAKKKKGK